MKCYLPVLLLTHSLPILLHFHTTASQQERERGRQSGCYFIKACQHGISYSRLIFSVYDVRCVSVVGVTNFVHLFVCTMNGLGMGWGLEVKRRCGIFLCAFFPHSIQHTWCFFHFIFCRMYISWRELCEKHDMCASIMEWIGHRHSFHV